MGMSENGVPPNPMVLLIVIPIKWLFHWEYTLFSDKPIWIIMKNHKNARNLETKLHRLGASAVMCGFLLALEPSRAMHWPLLHGWQGGAENARIRSSASSFEVFFCPIKCWFCCFRVEVTYCQKQTEEVDLVGLFELTFPLGLTEAGTTESPGDAFYHDGMRPAMIATTHRAPYCLII